MTQMAYQRTIRDRLAQIRRYHPLRNTYAEIMASMSKLDTLALWITARVATMKFFLLIATTTVIWLAWNGFAPMSWRFDAAPTFLIWAVGSSIIQLFLLPLIMVGQDLQGRHSEARAEHDLEINIKAEEEIELILHHLEKQNDMLIKQNEMLISMVKAQGDK